jgi:hypothetical protein
MGNTLQLVKTLKDTGEDFEWYPTTTEIIDVVKSDIDENNDDTHLSVLDCGSGDGRVLNALTKGKKYAIEKSRPLLNALDKSIFVVGTDFKSQTLIDKKVTVVFSNPPYSEFAQWATKIIKEANSAFVYLVIPSRWSENEAIKEAIDLRKAEVEVLGSFDFINAERQARAHVDIVRVALRYTGRFSGEAPKANPFDIWFDEFFKIDIANEEQSKYDLQSRSEASLHNKLKNALVTGGDLVIILEELYQKELANLIKIYQSFSDVDPSILRELDVNVRSVREGLCHKIENLKDRYWNELFNNMTTITDKLTTASRKTLLTTLTAHTHVDFTVANAHAVVTWVVKNANSYFDDQLIATVERMTEKANIQLYKSNQRTFGDEKWRYCRMPDDLDRYQLDYRVVLQRIGGIVTDSWSYSHGNGLSESASDFINDLCTIATNLGYDTQGHERANNLSWESNAKRQFEYKDASTGEDKSLFDVRAFKNGNLHLKFNPKFICRLNVEFGRLKGWLKSPKEAEEEMDIDAQTAMASFNTNLQITANNALALDFKKAA